MKDEGLKSEDGESGAGVLRLFVAISLPEAVKDEIEKAQKQFRAALPGNSIRWTKHEQFHLTLKFLGNVAEARVAQLIENLQDVGRRFPVMELRAEKIGFFPDARRPRVLWAGVENENDTLGRLQTAVELAVRDVILQNTASARPEHVSKEKYVGHVTLGRIERINRWDAEALSGTARSQSEQFFGNWLAEDFELIRSELSAVGARYTTLARIPFSGNP